MSNPRRIAIDLDGVCCDWCGPFWDLLSEYCPMQPLPDDGPVMWDWFAHYGATPEAIRLASARQTPRFWGGLPPHRDFTKRCREVLEDLCSEHEVTFVTARPCGREATISWLKRYLPLVSQPQVIVVPMLYSKADVLASLGFDVVIEDSYVNLRDMGYTFTTKILVTRPYTSKEVDLSVCLCRPAPSTLDAILLVQKVCASET